MDLPVSPLAPEILQELPPVRGVKFACAQAGIKYQGRNDVLLALFDEGTAVAGVLTRSRCPSAPVDWCREHLPGGKASALLVNAGNANAFTGMKGKDAVERSAKAVMDACGCAENEIFLASTGVIGEPLDAGKFDSFLSKMAAEASMDGWLDAASAIMTTDTFPKLTTRTVTMNGKPITINGIAKGSGMIAPDMATMLAFVFTDAPIAAKLLQAATSRLNQKSFNAITVDSDTSTSDTLLVFATGAARHDGIASIERKDDPRLATFERALDEILTDLAHQIVRDGEGATKFIEVNVTGAESDTSAHKIAMSIANSPLVKTAIAGEDANWGRVVMAVGKAGEPADRDKLAIWFGEIRVAVNGERDPDYSEDAATAVMQKDEIFLRADIGIGEGSASVFTCDLTKQYVAINGDYRS